MRYVMKQKLFSWGDDFAIRDEAGRDVFFVDGRAFTIGAKLSFQDMDGRELAFISQKLLSWGPTYEVHRDGTLVAVVKKKLFTFFKCQFTIDVPGPNDPVAEGDFLHHEYVIRRDGEVIATISKQWFTWTDTYGVDIRDGEDDGLRRVVEVIRESGADVVAMQETYGSGPRIADALGWYFYLRSSNISVLSRFPIVATHAVFEPFHCGGVTLDLGRRRKLSVFSLWIRHLLHSGVL